MRVGLLTAYVRATFEFQVTIGYLHQPEKWMQFVQGYHISFTSYNLLP